VNGSGESNPWIIFATVVALAALSIFELLYLFFDWQFAAVICRISFLAICLFLVPFFKFREWVLSLSAVFLTIGLLLENDGNDALLYSIDRAAFFAAFIYLVTLLKEAAQLSPSVFKLGTYLTSQPPGKRYFSLAYGGHLMGVLLNFGAISLLTPLILRGARAGSVSGAKDEQRVAHLEQQQISALLRGFSWMIMWSPTALTQAVLFTAFPSIDLKVVIPLGIASTIVMISIGRVEDRIRWRGERISQILPSLPFPFQAAFRFMLICTGLIGSTFLVVIACSVSAAIALMLIAPIMMAAWVFEQNYRGKIIQTFRQTICSLNQILFSSANLLARSAFTLGAAGFIGEAAAKLAPVDLFANYLAAIDMPGWLFLISLPILINLCGQIALSPILVVVFLSSIINQLPVLPADPNLIVFALGAGWALSMTASPNASATLLISGVTGIAPTTLTWRWNGVYALMCLAVFFMALIVLSI
jgi:hypothetical protein